jgi:retinol dehydrogenase 12
METSFTPRTYLVTGATSGIGRCIAEQLVESGANLIGVGRSAERCRDAETQLRAINPMVEVDYLVADLALQSEVLKAAEGTCTLLRKHGKTSLDGLVNNAGTFTYWLALTSEGFETQWAVNHLAPFRLTLELLPLLQAAPAARVITISSDSHYIARLNWNDIQLRRCYNGLRAYEQTKLANVLFTVELNRRLGEQQHVRAFAADPGLVKTDIGLKNNPGIVRWIWGLRRSGGISAAESAQGIITLLTDPSIQESNAVYWKHGKPKPSSRYSLDSEAARRLWDLSATMCAL